MLTFKCRGNTLAASTKHDFPNVDSAKYSAFVIARRILRDCLDENQPFDMDTYCEITNDVQRVVHAFTFRECTD